MTTVSVARVDHYCEKLVCEMSNLVLNRIELFGVDMGLYFLLNLYRFLFSLLLGFLIVYDLIILLFCWFVVVLFGIALFRFIISSLFLLLAFITKLVNK